MWSRTAPGDDLELLYRIGRDKDPVVLGVTIVTTPSLRISEPRVILDLDELRVQLMEPLPDGRFLIAQQEEQVENQFGRINVVFNWFDELERRTGK